MYRPGGGGGEEGLVVTWFEPIVTWNIPAADIVANIHIPQ
jgi:hypothetical protein